MGSRGGLKQTCRQCSFPPVGQPMPPACHLQPPDCNPQHPLHQQPPIPQPAACKSPMCSFLSPQPAAPNPPTCSLYFHTLQTALSPHLWAAAAAAPPPQPPWRRPCHRHWHPLPLPRRPLLPPDRRRCHQCPGVTCAGVTGTGVTAAGGGPQAAHIKIFRSQAVVLCVEGIAAQRA